jgi:hypothetical protein
MLARVTHDELRALLPRYAAGELEAEDALGIRAHLADGCAACLDEVFRSPIGLRASNAPAPYRPRRRRWRRLAVVILVATLVFGATALVWSMVVDLRRRETAARAEIAAAERRLTQRAADVSALGARVAVLEREVGAARAALARSADADVEITRLRDRLDTAGEQIAQLVRDVGRRDAQLDRLRVSVAERQVVRKLVTTSGVEVLGLTAVPPFGSARGHVVWHPDQTDLVLYAFDLPRAPAGAMYRVRLRADGTPAREAPAFRPGVRGEVTLPLHLDVPGAALREVVVVRTLDGQPVLAGRRASPEER